MQTTAQRTGRIVGPPKASPEPGTTADDAMSRRGCLMSIWGHHTYLYISKASISETEGTCNLAAPIPNVTVNY